MKIYKNKIIKMLLLTITILLMMSFSTFANNFEITLDPDDESNGDIFVDYDTEEEDKDYKFVWDNSSFEEVANTVSGELADINTEYVIFETDDEKLQKYFDELKESGVPVTEGAIFVFPYYEVERKENKKSGDILTLDITPRYDLIVANTKNKEEIVLSEIDGIINSICVEKGKKIEIETEIELEFELPKHLKLKEGAKYYIRHIKSDGTVYYYRVKIKNGKVYFKNPHGFSEFTLMEDERLIKIKYPAETKEYTILNVGEDLPKEKKSGYTFKGWKFEGIEDKIYTTFTEELLDKLSKIEGEIEATPQFKRKASRKVSASSKNTSTELQKAEEEKRKEECFEVLKSAYEKGLFKEIEQHMIETEMYDLIINLVECLKKK